MHDIIHCIILYVLVSIHVDRFKSVYYSVYLGSYVRMFVLCSDQLLTPAHAVLPIGRIPLFLIYSVNCWGISARTALANASGLDCVSCVHVCTSIVMTC